MIGIKIVTYWPYGISGVFRQIGLPLGVNLLEVFNLPPGNHEPQADSISDLRLVGPIRGKCRDICFLIRDEER